MSRHGMMIDRAYTQAQKAMRSLGITQRQLAEASGVSLPTVNRCLNEFQFQNVKHADVVRVRCALEVLSEGEINDFSEYDAQVPCLRLGGLGA